MWKIQFPSRYLISSEKQKVYLNVKQSLDNEETCIFNTFNKHFMSKYAQWTTLDLFNPNIPLFWREKVNSENVIIWYLILSIET